MKKIYLSIVMAVYTVVTFAQAGIISTFAGNGSANYGGDGGQASATELNYPVGVAVDAVGNIYITDENNNRVRMVNTNGIISTLAGNGTAGYSGDGGAATAAELSDPAGVTFDAAGNLYIGDASNMVVRKVNTAGIITTFAGNGSAGYSGDGGAATAAKLFTPYGVTFDAAGNLYIAEENNSIIRKVNTAGIISTFAGNGTQGYSGDGGQATAAELNKANGVALDAAGNLYITDELNNRIRIVNSVGIISTFAGNGTQGYSGDGGMATAAELHWPAGITLDAAGNVYFGDYSNNRVRMINTAGFISTVAGNGIGAFSGNGGQATAAELNGPAGITLDAAGNMYIADVANQRVRKVTGSGQTTDIVYHTAINNNSISIYPNPATGMLNVEGLMLNDNISICDVLGNEVIATKEKQIDISSLANGIYFIKTTQGTQKLIKQ